MGELIQKEPGIYCNVDANEYFAWDAVSNTSLSRMNKSPRHYKYEAETKETKSMLCGSLTHLGRLQPMEVAELYAVMPAYHLDEENCDTKGNQSESKATNYVKHKEKLFKAANSRRIVCNQETYDQAKQIVEALHADPEAQRCLNGAGPVEVSIVWDDPDTGIRCKARLDRVNTDCGRLVDLKTAGNIFKFRNSIANYGYHRQLAHYQEGWAILNGGEQLEPWIVAAESVTPFCVQAAKVADATIEQGYKERDRLLKRVAECMGSGEWPGPEPPEAWELPEWAVDQEPLVLTIGGKQTEV